MNVLAVERETLMFRDVEFRLLPEGLKTGSSDTYCTWRVEKIAHTSLPPEPFNTAFNTPATEISV